MTNRLQVKSKSSTAEITVPGRQQCAQSSAKRNYSISSTVQPPCLQPLQRAHLRPTLQSTVADKDAWEPKAMKACTILLSSIKGNLITYVEDEDNPATIWRILKDRFRPTTDITLAQALKHLFAMRMAENGDMEAHVRDFTAAKRRVEEHSVRLTDIVYRTLFLLSLPMTYQMTVTALEGKAG